MLMGQPRRTKSPSNVDDVARDHKDHGREDDKQVSTEVPSCVDIRGRWEIVLPRPVSEEPNMEGVERDGSTQTSQKTSPEHEAAIPAEEERD